MGEDGGVAGERTARVWAWIAASRDGDEPVYLAALCRAAVHRLGVDGASVTAVGGPAVRRYARDHNHRLTQLAADVISGTVRIARNGL